MRILALLAEAELTVSELTAILRQSQPRISRHLRLLMQAGLVDRFREGAWAVIILIILLVLLFRKINHHYADVAAQLRLPKLHLPATDVKNTVPKVQQGLKAAALMPESGTKYGLAIHTRLRAFKMPAKYVSRIAL